MVQSSVLLQPLNVTLTLFDTLRPHLSSPSYRTSNLHSPTAYIDIRLCTPTPDSDLGDSARRGEREMTPPWRVVVYNRSWSDGVGCDGTRRRICFRLLEGLPSHAYTREKLTICAQTHALPGPLLLPSSSFDHPGSSYTHACTRRQVTN